MIHHPWHEVKPEFNETQGLINCIIEIPAGSKAKYEVDKLTGLIKLDRVLSAAFVYPINYGFMPQTMGADGDPLDILVLSQVSIEPLCLVNAKIIGLMEMVDTGIRDEKILAVANSDPGVNHITSIGDLSENFKMELKHFFSHYKNLENKKVDVFEFLPMQNAFASIKQSFEKYNHHFSA